MCQQVLGCHNPHHGQGTVRLLVLCPAAAVTVTVCHLLQCGSGQPGPRQQLCGSDTVTACHRQEAAGHWGGPESRSVQCQTATGGKTRLVWAHTRVCFTTARCMLSDSSRNTALDRFTHRSAVAPHTVLQTTSLLGAGA